MNNVNPNHEQGGEDYHSASGSVRFEKGEVQKQVSRLQAKQQQTKKHAEHAKHTTTTKRKNKIVVSCSASWTATLEKGSHSIR
jgi:hypothetical protein